MQLYTEQDFETTKRTFRARVVIAALILVAIIGLLIVFVTAVRSLIATEAVIIVGMCLLYAFISLKLLPWYSYWRYQVDIREGMSHEIEAAFVSCADSVRISDGVAFHELIVRVGEEEEDERLFFWDDDKQLPPLSEGQKVSIRSFGNYITELTPE